MHYRYDNLDALLQKRDQLMTELDAERSTHNYGSSPILQPIFQPPHQVQFSGQDLGSNTLDNGSTKNLRNIDHKVLPNLHHIRPQYFIPRNDSENAFGKKPRPYTFKQMKQDQILDYTTSGSNNRIISGITSQIDSLPNLSIAHGNKINSPSSLM